MKKSLILFTIVIFVIAFTSCTQYSCPTYTNVPVENPTVKI